MRVETLGKHRENNAPRVPDRGRWGGRHSALWFAVPRFLPFDRGADLIILYTWRQDLRRSEGHRWLSSGDGIPCAAVTSLSALTSAAASSTTELIKVSGNFTCSSDVTVASNKTIQGVGSSSGLTGCGLKIEGVSNVIVQNMKIAKVLAG